MGIFTPSRRQTRRNIKRTAMHTGQMVAIERLQLHLAYEALQMQATQMHIAATAHLAAQLPGLPSAAGNPT